MLKFRSLASQLCGIFPYVCLQFALGSFMGFQTILIAELYKKDSEIPTTNDELSWFASLNTVKLVGSLTTGLLMHRLGSRLTALITALIYATSLLLYHYATTVTVILGSRILLSLVTSVKSVCTPYISEVSEPHLRGRLLTVSFLSHAVGSFFSLLLGSLMYWRTIALVNVAFPILAFLTVLATPNSPSWLASKGRFDEAEKALCWLRGWVKPIHVQTEFRALLDNVQKLKSTSDERKAEVNKRNWREGVIQFCHPFVQRSFYLPLVTMFTIIFVYDLTGSGPIESYATVIFGKLNSPIEESITSAINGAMTIIGSLIILLSIRRVGKRNLVLFCVAVAALCEIIGAIIGFLGLRGQYLWIPSITMIIAAVATHSGVEMMVQMLNSEIFPTSIRYIGASIAFSFNMAMTGVMNKLFLYMVDAMTLPGVLLFFASANLAALVTYYFLFPETEGKSLKEIEDLFDGTKSLTRRKQQRPNVRYS